MQNMSRKIGLLLAFKECVSVKIFFLLNIRFFYKQYLYKEQQAETGKKSGKS